MNKNQVTCRRGLTLQRARMDKDKGLGFISLTYDHASYIHGHHISDGLCECCLERCGGSSGEADALYQLFAKYLLMIGCVSDRSGRRRWHCVDRVRDDDRSQE